MAQSTGAKATQRACLGRAPRRTPASSEGPSRSPLKRRRGGGAGNGRGMHFLAPHAQPSPRPGQASTQCLRCDWADFSGTCPHPRGPSWATGTLEHSQPGSCLRGWGENQATGSQPTARGAIVLWERGRVPAGPLGHGPPTPPLEQQHRARAGPWPDTEPVSVHSD